MHIRFYTFFSLLFLGFTSSAQYLPSGNLTIFSENGNRFFLILNGEQQNDIAETNIRIEELPQPYYNCKIIFEDKSIPPISKNYLQIADASGIMQDVTYKIKQEKNGKQSLKFFSFIPATQNMVRPPQCAVYRYGNPNQIIAGPGFRANIQSGGGGVSIDVHGKMQVQTNPYDNTYPTYRDNYQNSHNNNQKRHQEYSNHYYNDNNYTIQGCDRAYPMNVNDFEAACGTLRNEGFDETRLDIAKQIASTNCLNTNQIMSVIKLFSFEASRLEFAKYAFDHCTDPNNYFKVSNSFSFSSSKTELNNYIRGRY